MKKIGESP